MKFLYFLKQILKNCLTNKLVYLFILENKWIPTVRMLFYADNTVDTILYL